MPPARSRNAKNPIERRCQNPPDMQDEAAMRAYNLGVRQFHRQAEIINACIKTYADDAWSEITHIQEIVHTALTTANQH
jgi:hypothetical protein